MIFNKYYDLIKINLGYFNNKYDIKKILYKPNFQQYHIFIDQDLYLILKEPFIDINSFIK